jgi:hypothetical protein
VVTPARAIKLEEELAERFRKFKEESTNFSREVAAILDSNYDFGPSDRVNATLFLAKTVFSKWSIDILTLLYGLRSASLGEIKKNLEEITHAFYLQS